MRLAQAPVPVETLPVDVDKEPTAEEDTAEKADGDEQTKANTEEPTVRRQLCEEMRASLEAVGVPLEEAGVTFYKSVVCALSATLHSFAYSSA